MSYTPTVWKTGDIVTSEKLNKLENAIPQGGVMMIGTEEIDDTTYLTATWQEINDAMRNGNVVFVREIHDGEEYPFDVSISSLIINKVYGDPNNNLYGVEYRSSNYETDSPNGRPYGDTK